MNKQQTKVYSLNFLYSLGYNGISKILPVFLTAFSNSALQIGMVNSAYQLGRTISTVFSGYIADKIGKNKAILLAFLFNTLLSFSLVFANSISFFVIAFFAIGLIASLFYAGLNAIASILFEKKGDGFSKLEMSYQVGFVLAPLIGGAIAASIGMPVVFILATIVSAIGLMLSVFLPKEENEKITVKKTLGSIFNIVKENVWGFVTFALVGSFFIGLIEGARDLLIALYSVDLGLGIWEIGLIFAISPLITIIGINPIGKISDRIGRGFSILIGLGLIILSFILLPFANSVIFLGVLTGLLSLGRTAGLVSTRAFAADLIPTRVRATGLSFFEIIFSAGKVVGPLLAGVLKDNLGATQAFSIFIYITIGVAVFIGLYFVKKELAKK